jgi:hypothetical protein
VERKCNRGVGIREETKLTRSLFMYPGYLNVVVEAAMTVETCVDDHGSNELERFSMTDVFQISLTS